MSNKIEEALTKLFKSHRVIFWYDKDCEFQDDFNEIEFSNVDKLQVNSNEFQVKYIVSKEKATQKFLLYFTTVKPLNEDNWLLDLELAHHVFHTDQETMFLQELGLGYHLKELVAEHIDFFKAKERRQKLKELLGTGDEHQEIRYKMLAVLFGTENVSLVTYIHAHGSAFSEGNDKIDKDLERFGLSVYYWKEIARKFNYRNETPSIYDFLLEIFNNNFTLGQNTGLSRESGLLLSLWKDSVQFREGFGSISDKVARDLDVETKLNKATIDEIIGDDLFKLTDKKIIYELVSLITSEQLSIEKVGQYIKQRENKIWFVDYKNIYDCLSHASKMIALVRKHANKSYKTIEEGSADYSSSLYEIDQFYRKFIWGYRQTKQDKILFQLAEKIEKVYSNDWLLTYNNNWQKVIDDIDVWPTNSRNSQQMFFDTHVKPIVEKKQRLFVIISDALRYECGSELRKMLHSENRYEASIDHMISSLPSYTQLGMASLLPHKTISLQDKKDLIMIDGMSSAGTKGRNKILQANSGVRATAVKAEDFMKMNSASEGRDFVKQHDLIYIYHNRIDKTGDDKTTEEKVFEAVDNELQFLMDLLKKITNMNGNNMLVTTDHGFIYQNNYLEESDFSVSKHQGEVWKENRRFVIGQNLSGDSVTKAFKGHDLNISNEVDVLIPKSINRLRVSGSGTRFIHGGASLQEIVLPLIKITKKRQDTTTQVEVDIIKTTDRITTNILLISFLQSNLVTDQVLPRTVRAGIYADDGELLSDQFKYLFDISEGSERQREVKHRFQLMAKATGKYKNQQVKLILEEPVEGTTRWKEFKNYSFNLNISFTNDFDI